MQIKLPPPSLPSPLLPERQPSSDRSTDSATSVASPDKSSGTKPFIVKSGMHNLTRFTMLFGRTEANTSASPRPHKRSISTDSIGTPILESARAFKEIAALSSIEHNSEIETFWSATKLRNDSKAGIDWNNYLQAAQGSDQHAAIMTLQDKLKEIDGKANKGIEELRQTAYEDIRNAKRQLTPRHQIDAKNLTKPTLQERLSVGSDRARMRSRRLTKREELVKEREASDVKSAINRFKQRATDDFERSRLKDVKRACAHALDQHFPDQVPTGPLYQLVSKISPEAAKQVMSKFDLKTQMEFFANYSVVPKDDPLF